MEASSALLVTATLVIAFLSPMRAEPIQGCGGFVEASPALAKLRKPGHPKLDYSYTTVELHTVDGLVKDKTQCAPNGYYFLPVYDKGTFSLRVKGPDGWSFEPSKVTVAVGQNGCNDNEDINFWYTGFSISGKIPGAVGGTSCSANGQGPAGVRVDLFPDTVDDSSHESISSITSQGGSYKFENLLIGKYRLSASHPELQVELRGDPEVEVNWASVIVDDVFFVSGYNLEGSVASQGNPVLGVQFYLHSNDFHELHCPQGSGSSPSLPALWHAVSGEDGRFIMSNVPCGQYKLVPFYKGENTIFDVSPSSVQVSVQHESVVLIDPFQVTGFSVAGRIVTSKGAGVEEAKIFVNNVQRAISDSEGFYKLDQVTSTHYTIKVEKPHYKFSPLDNFLVLPNMAFIPDIRATHFDLCGSIEILDNVSADKRQVQLTNGSASVKPLTKEVDDKGVFCFEVSPGEYHLSPLTTREERAAGLLFSPPFVDVVVDAPVFDASFIQALVHIAGGVKCKAHCDHNISVSLVPLPKAGSTVTGFSIQRWTRLEPSKDSFVFENVLPGKYRLEVRHKPPSFLENLDDDWCWEQKQIDVVVGIDYLAGLTFVQKGYWLPIESSHAADAFTLQPHKEPVPLQIKKGWQQVCLEHPGVHELHFLSPCTFFGELFFAYHTAKPQTLRLVGQKYLLNGRIHIDSRLYPEANRLKSSISVDVRREDVVLSQNCAHLLLEANESDTVAVYEFSHWANIEDKLVFVPRHTGATPELDVDEPVSSDGHEKSLLFYPVSQQVHVEVDGCQPEIPTFHGRPGVHLRGNVYPALQGVIITAIANAVSNAGSLKGGDVALRTSTSEDGSFVAGPLFDDTSYSVKAEKVGYYFKPLGNNTFACQKLGQIVVQIFPGEGAESQLPEVLLSLSGDDGYRKNAVTGSRGMLTFNNLFPGSFFLRAFLKEYSFSPPAEAIEVESGEVKDVRFVAKRVAYRCFGLVGLIIFAKSVCPFDSGGKLAYSAMQQDWHSVLGTVRSLSGRPQEGVYLGAQSQGGELYEETLSDAEGKFRLRGLLPGSSYTIRVIRRIDPGVQLKVERAVPVSVSVKVGLEDTANVNFVVFEQPATAALTGVAEGQNAVETRRWQPHLIVEVAAAADTSNMQTKRIPVTNFFEFGGLGNMKYVVRLVLDFSERTYHFFSDPVEVDLETKNDIHLEPLKFVVKERLHKQELTSAPVVPIVVAVLAVALYANMSRFRVVYQAVGGGGSSSGAVAPKKEVKKTTLRKRTY